MRLDSIAYVQSLNQEALNRVCRPYLGRGMHYHEDVRFELMHGKMKYLNGSEYDLVRDLVASLATLEEFLIANTPKR